MNIRILYLLMTIASIGFPVVALSQTPTLGTTVDFVLFSSVGAVTNTGITHLTGNVGANNGSITGFGNVDGGMHDGDLVSAKCATDLLTLYGELNAATPTFFPSIALGNGQLLTPGIYAIANPATLDLELILDGQNDPNALFIIQIAGAFSTHTGSKVTLINGAKACNVFWKVEGVVDMAAGTTMRGTVLANNAAINMNAGDILEGRLLSINGAITVNNSTARIPDGGGSPHLTGPIPPTMNSAACFALFSLNGALSNVGISNVKGDIGTNVGLTLGFDPLLVQGTIHPIPDVATANCAVDVLATNAYLTALASDIELLYPAQFGNSLVLTPHTYILNGAVSLTDTLFLNAKGDTNAVFVIQIYGALSTSTYANIVLLNGTKSKNVYWKVNGAVDLNDYTTFRGTIICNNGAIILKTGVYLDGRALTTTGALSTVAMSVVTPTSCAPQIVLQPNDLVVCEGTIASFEVVADGIGITYQWRKGTINLTNDTRISGANTSILTIDPTISSDTASDYNVIVGGAYMPNDTSNLISLNINTAPIITNVILDQTVCSGNSVSFEAIATGTGISYQWRKGAVNLTNGSNISGAQSNILILNPATILDTASNYNVIVSGVCNPNDTSNLISLNINTAPIITNVILDQTVCSGNSVSFEAIATGTGISYQWRKGAVNLTNGSNISGAQSNILTLNPATILDTASNYNVIVSGVCLPNDTSNLIALHINTAPIITNVILDQTVCSGNLVSFEATASGTGITYQWRKGAVNLTNGSNISGAQSNILILNPATILDTASNYNVIVSGICLPNDTSNLISLNINTAPIITNVIIDQTVCSGDSVSIEAIANGLGLTYQWRKGNLNLTNGGNISGAQSNILKINPIAVADSGSNYNVIVSGICLPNDTSNLIALHINTAPIITNVILDQTVCRGDSVSMEATANGLGLSYQWRKGNLNLTNGGNISGAQSNILKINPITVADSGSNYNVIVSGICLPNDTSNSISITVNKKPIAVATSVYPVATGSPIYLYADTVVGASYAWSGPNNFTSLLQRPVILSAADIHSGTYILHVTNNACVSLPDSTDILVMVLLTTRIDLSIVKTASSFLPVKGKNMVFTIVASNNSANDATGVTVTEILQNGYTYVSSSISTGTFDATTGIWNIGNLQQGKSEIMTITVLVNRTGDYTNTVTITGNESDTLIENNVSSSNPAPTDFLIPEGFSPNGDGINDLFVIRGILNYSNNSFEIFNRWGEKIYSSAPYKNTWDGNTSKTSVGGNELPSGLYFYWLDLGEGATPIKGSIYLTR